MGMAAVSVPESKNGNPVGNSLSSGYYVCVMSAIEIIEQIKVLSPDEQAKVIAFAVELHETSQRSNDISADDFRNLVNRTFDKHENLMQRLAQ